MKHLEPTQLKPAIALRSICHRHKGKLATIAIGAVATLGGYLDISAIAASPHAPSNTVSRQLPDGVTAQTVQMGRALFHGQGGCYHCHGKNGSGSFFAPALNDERRIHLQTASYDEILNRIRSGVPEPKRYPVAMPPMGGAPLTDNDARAVAAYVFSIDRGP